MEISPPIQSGSNGPLAKECHRFLVAGPFNFWKEVRYFSDQVRTRRNTDSGASTSSITAPSRYFRE